MHRIEVAVGIVHGDGGRVLVGQRTVPDAYYAKWEFPGGKLDESESAEQALIREFREEVGIDIQSSRPLLQLEHDYPDRKVRLYIRIVDSYTGEVRPMEGQALRWVTLDELDQLDFLTGNQAIIDALRARTC